MSILGIFLVLPVLNGFSMKEYCHKKDFSSEQPFFYQQGKLEFGRCSSINVLRRLSRLGMIDCVRECLVTSQCKGINYRPDWQMCDVVGEIISKDLGPEDGCVHSNISTWPEDCNDLPKWSNSGVYVVRTNIKVFCDMDTDSGGWTVIQHRFNGMQTFEKSWHEYKTGFGDVSGEFWLGDGMTDFSQNSLNGMSFSTADRNQDMSDIHDCADFKRSGWWHRDCTKGNVNGLYRPGEQGNDVMHWRTLNGTYSLSMTRMMIKPASI
ncbi:unnamed protein product [Mytilus coruscus]|uniref:Fibrinogen C-terminal domain-containing protein n=1 Tax=Mytilus coruscus TaxID=42192 RepID=A0A6J8CPI4_MYTCO|nr:unnamed protein product [Mytilus coruscus]